MGSKHAVLVSYLALFIALGGTATALQGRYSVKADDLATGSVGKRVLHARSVGAGELTANVVGPRNIKRGAVGPGHLRANSVGTRALAQRSVGRFTLKPGAVDAEALLNGAITSEELAPQVEVSFGSAGKVSGRNSTLRINAQQLEWSRSAAGHAPVLFDASPTGGGGVVLDGSLGPQSGYLRLVEGDGLPPSLNNAATLVARDDGSGNTQLVVYWPGGMSEVLAAEGP